MLTEMVVPISDLRYASIECGDAKCKTVVTIDLEMDVSDPFQCPACKQPYNLRDNISDLRSVYRSLSQHYTKISFRAAIVSDRNTASGTGTTQRE
jgi:hypothetical protein